MWSQVLLPIAGLILLGIPCIQVWRARRAGKRLAMLDRRSAASWFLFFGCTQIIFGVLNLREVYAREYAYWWFLLGPCTLLNGIVRPQVWEGGILWSPWVYVPWTSITSYAMAGGTLRVQLRRGRIALMHELTIPIKQDQLGIVQEIMAQHLP